MDDARVVRGALRRAARGHVRVPDRRLRPDLDRRRLRRGDQTDRRALHGRGRRRVRGRELRRPGRHRRRVGLRQSGDRCGDGAAAGRRRGHGLRRDAHLPGRAGGPGADVRAIADRAAHASARLRRRELGDARAVRGRTSRLPGAADRRLLPGQPALSDGGGHIPDHRRRAAGVHQLAERAPGRSADRAVPRGVCVQRVRREAAGPRRADRQGVGARTDVRLDQPHLGSHRDGRDGLREGLRRAQPEQSIRRRVRTVALLGREPGHAQPDGPEERRSDARGITTWVSGRW